jgi:hypothetical protein
MRFHSVIFVFVVSFVLAGCAASTLQELIERLPTTVPSDQSPEVVSAKTQNLSPQEFYDLYAVPASCAVTPMVGQERRRTFPAWWLDGDGMAAGTPIGVLFEGENKIQWQLEHPGTLVISGKRLDGQEPPLEAENIIPISVNPATFELATYSSNIIFSTPGCWGFHAEAGSQSLDAIVYVYPYSCRPPNMRGRPGEPSEALCRAPG